MAMKARYTVVEGEVVAEKRNGAGRRQYVPDPLGSTAALLDGTQTQTDTFQYWPYGEVSGRTGTTTTPFQYVGTLGYYRDSAIRSYVRARYLDVQAGRWITQDPIKFDGEDWNIYRYTGSNPTSFTDPSGQITIDKSCSAEQRKRIAASLDALCDPKAQAAFDECIESCCGQMAIPSCVEYQCNKKSDLTIYCASKFNADCGARFAPGKDSCGYSPSKHSIILCPIFFTDKRCGYGRCTIAHEFIHSCGKISHPAECFNCVKKTFPSYCN